MGFIITVLFSIAVLALYFTIQYWWIILIITVVIALSVLLGCLAFNKSLDNVVSAEIISENPIISRVSEKTGHTTSYGRNLSYHEHYRDRNVITGYNITFAVEYENGKRGEITCKKGGGTYKKLITRCNKQQSVL